jgi:hypothetical protein
MRALVLCTITILAGGGLVALGACGGSETTGGPGDGGSESSSGSSGNTDARADGASSSGDAAPVCNTIAQQGQSVPVFGGVRPFPTGTGGTVQNGTYVLTDARIHAVVQDGQPAFGQSLPATTIELNGNTGQAVTDTGTNEAHHTVDFTTNGINFTMTPTCTTAAAGMGALNFEGTFTADTNDAGAQRFKIYIQYDTGIVGMQPVSAEFTKR